MGLLGDLKKIIFGTKSVAKSGYNKAKEEGGEILDSVMDKGQDLAEVAYEKGQDIAESAAKKGFEIKDRLEDKLDNLVDSFTKDTEDIIVTEKDLPAINIPDTPSVEKTNPSTTDKMEDMASNIGSKTREIGQGLADKAEVFGKDLAEKANELGSKAADRFGDAANKLGDKIHDGKDALVEKAKEAAAKLDEKLDETIEKAKALDAQIESENNDKDGDGFADKPADLGGSLLEGKDDFFSKAEKFAKGESINPSEASTKDVNITTVSSPEKPEYKSYGFEDRDGDGNDVVDDAIVEEE